MKLIPLTRGYSAMVDDNDHYGLSLINWCTSVFNGRCYAKNRSFGKMHRFIMAVDDAFHVDHIDGNGLNNQRLNLRICTRTENMRNQKKGKNLSSKYKGASWNKRDCAWYARIKFMNKNLYLGRFSSERDAAMAYDNAAKKYFGEFACLNFKEAL